ncbi:MAG: xanthine dehydrogenase family protein molybdopterin-binding subunit [Candidatus Limnocylindrales bacterium]
MTSRSAPPRVAPAPLIVPAGAIVPGRAQAAEPRRREGPAKLTGEARYTDDLIFPGAWYGATVRSSEAHARLEAIELDPVFDWSAVVVVTAADIPGENVVNGIADDQPALVPVGGEIRHHAEPVCLIAAPDKATLEAARARVVLRTTALPAIFDPLLSETVFAHYDIGRGDVEAALASADLVLEGSYRVGHQEQLYIENNAMIALPREDGGIEVHGSMQCPYYAHKALKRALALDAIRTVVIQEETGGGFGGKEEYPSMIAIHAALLARRCRRPVRMIYDRHEDLAATTKRHPAVVRHRTGVLRDGTLVAQDVEIVMDGGAYCTLSPVVLSRGTLHAGGPYRCPNVRIRSRVVATNTPPNGAFRGFGAPQVEFAVETHLGRIAEALGISPLELRRRNAYQLGDSTPFGQVLRESVAAEQVLETAAAAADLETKWALSARVRAARPRSRGRRRTTRGVGLALGWHGNGFTGSGEAKMGSTAAVELTAAGAIRVLVAATEMGQGTSTIMPMLVAEALGVPAEAVDVVRPDTSIVPDSGPTVASRTAMVVGRMVIEAARSLRAQVEAETGRPFAASYTEYARLHGQLRVDQVFEPYPGASFDDATYTGDAYPVYGWAACVAEVEVDLDTCEVAVLEVVAVDEVGRVLHRVLAEGQVEGGTLQAIGYATIEEIKLHDGRYLNDRLATYLIPTALDAPRTTTILLESPYSGSPHGAKGMGELPMDVGAPAVVAAIADATGVWVTELPATPERILAALGATSAGAGDAL